jgi:serine/threonine protein kinase
MSAAFTTEQIATHFDDIDIQREIEGGANKQVYEAEYNGETVAFKILPIDSRRIEGYARREIESMQKIDSPVLVDLIDHAATEIDGTYVIVILEEFVPGNTLKGILEETGEDLNLGLNVTQSLLSILPLFDEEDIIHRDIKPENIMVRPNSEITLLDLGIARMQNRTSLTPTFAAHAPGTYAYSAPEQLKNEKEIQDCRTDLFATGIVMFESITGEHPFAPDGIDITIPDAILQEERKELNGYLKDTDFETELNQFYKKMTAYEPYERFRKAEFAREEFDDIIGKTNV